MTTPKRVALHYLLLVAFAAFALASDATDGLEAELERLASAGDAAFDRGELEESSRAFTTGLALAERAGVATQIPRFRRNAAVVELARNHPAAALVALERALRELPEDDPDRDAFLISLDGDLARAYQHLGGRRRAAATLERGLALARRSGDLAAEVNLGIRRALLFTTVGAHDSALATLEALEPSAHAASPRGDRAWLASVTGGVLRALGDEARAGAAFALAVALERQGANPALLAAALASEGDSRLARDPAGAARSFVEAETLAAPRRLPLVLATIASGRGELLRAGGEEARALELHRRAADFAEEAALLLDSPVRQASFARENRSFFERWIEAALARGDEAGEREALLASERLRRLETLDLGVAPVGRAEGAAPAPPSKDHALRAALAPQEVALVYRFLAGRLLVFVLDRERLELFELELDRRDLARDVELYLQLLARGEPTAWRPAAARLYRLLVAPLPDWARERGRSWIVVGDGALDTLPFETLVAEASAPPLVVERAIATVPSLGWLARARGEKRPRVRARSGPTALLVAVSGEGSASDEPAVVERRAIWTEERVFLQPIPAVRLEAEAVGRLLPADAVRQTGGTVSEAELDGVPLASLELLHFATHAFAPEEEPERSALWLGRAGGADYDGVLEAREIATHRFDAALVVLSACETLGRPTRDGSRGLASAFLAAGARSVVATRWRLGDASGAELMARFYQRLAAGDAVGEALRFAQLELYADPRFAAPAAWAAAVVVGDPETALADLLVAPPSPIARRTRWLGVALGAVATLFGWRWIARRPVDRAASVR